MERDEVLGPKVPESAEAEQQPAEVEAREEASLSGLGAKRLAAQTLPAETSCESYKWRPAVVLDGTKAILRISNNQPFQVDHSLRIIFSSCKLRRIERSVTYSTFISDAPETTVVVDSGTPYHRFVPVLLAATGGIVYTREGIAHILIGGSVEVIRSKVSAPSLPSKACNKFAVDTIWSSLPQHEKTALRNQAIFPWSLDVSIARNNTTGGLLLVRVDESVFRYKIGRGVLGQCSMTSSPREDELPTETVEFADGRALMWTVGVTFLFVHSMYCYKRVLGASGHGIVWVENPRQSTVGGTSPQHNA